MEIPVYLFTGFLEAGKTTIIQDSLSDGSFNCGERWLVILCEEGEVELDLTKMAHGADKVTVVTFDEEQLLTADRLSAAQKRAKADRVIIEYNGMWNIQTVYDNLPEGWYIGEELCLIDSTTALAYNANMRQQMYDKLQSPAMVIFNRVVKDADVTPFHKLVRGVNRRAQIGYEYVDGSFVPDDRTVFGRDCPRPRYEERYLCCGERDYDLLCSGYGISPSHCKVRESKHLEKRLMGLGDGENQDRGMSILFRDWSRFVRDGCRGGVKARRDCYHVLLILLYINSTASPAVLFYVSQIERAPERSTCQVENWDGYLPGAIWHGLPSVGEPPPSARAMRPRTALCATVSPALLQKEQAPERSACQVEN